jgi:ArsR family transcriptional regulator, lead/cadmium/zinc/bismuth-responsive transcriptional repressor
LYEQLLRCSYMQKTTDLMPPPVLAHSDEAACDTFHVHPALVARLREALITTVDVAALAETFRVLGDTTRVRILDALSHLELCVCDLAALLGLTESAVSHQLRLLRGMRLVRSRREGRMVFYTLDDQHIVRLFREGLGHVEEAPVRGRTTRLRAADEDGESEATPRGKVE